jgi:hypothetical protein
MSNKDPIVEEVHEVRASIAKEAGYDLDRLVEAARARQSTSGREVVRLPPRKPDIARTAS